MKLKLVFSLVVLINLNLFAQKEKDKAKPDIDENEILKNYSDEACKCIDSIHVFDKTKGEVSEEIKSCIDKQVLAYQIVLSFNNALKNEKDSLKTTEIIITDNKESEQYREYYYDIERFLMENCDALKQKVAADDKTRINSMSTNEEAIAFYDEGVILYEKANFEKAKKTFQKALDIDPKFAFAWDNLGLSYRQLGDYDKAIECYQKSLEIDPYGTLPLQNIAVAYEYKKEWNNALKAYQRLAEIDENNPETYYGMGRIYALQEELEKALDNICIAYVLYVKLNSPYRADAENILSYLYGQMKAQGKEDRFDEILDSHHINH